jgi:hypothetical protein
MSLRPRRHIIIGVCLDVKAVDVEYKAAFDLSVVHPLFDLRYFILPSID